MIYRIPFVAIFYLSQWAFNVVVVVVAQDDNNNNNNSNNDTSDAPSLSPSTIPTGQYASSDAPSLSPYIDGNKLSDMPSALPFRSAPIDSSSSSTSDMPSSSPGDNEQQQQQQSSPTAATVNPPPSSPPGPAPTENVNNNGVGTPTDGGDSSPPADNPPLTDGNTPPATATDSEGNGNGDVQGNGSGQGNGDGQGNGNVGTPAGQPEGCKKLDEMCTASEECCFKRICFEGTCHKRDDVPQENTGRQRTRILMGGLRGVVQY